MVEKVIFFLILRIMNIRRIMRMIRIIKMRMGMVKIIIKIRIRMNLRMI